MAESLTTEATPLVAGGDGVIRVRGTRVTLDTLVAAFTDGATPEEMAQQYPSVALADIYHVIAYYLRRPADLEAYFAKRQREIEEARRANESRWPPDGIRERLLARRQR